MCGAKDTPQWRLNPNGGGHLCNRYGCGCLCVCVCVCACVLVRQCAQHSVRSHALRFHAALHGHSPTPCVSSMLRAKSANSYCTKLMTILCVGV